MSRLDVYTAVHKMQRARLFALTVESGTADPEDVQTRRALAEAVDALVTELLAHAEHEDRFIHPLLRTYAPTVAARLDAEHHDLDSRLAELRTVASHYADNPSQPNGLYRALAAFTGRYLAHLAVEESDALPALWGDCSDDELAGILRMFKESRSDVENLTDLLAQLPMLNPTERRNMISVGLNAPDRDAAQCILATLLQPTQLGALAMA